MSHIFSQTAYGIIPASTSRHLFAYSQLCWFYFLGSAGSVGGGLKVFTEAILSRCSFLEKQVISLGGLIKDLELLLIFKFSPVKLQLTSQ